MISQKTIVLEDVLEKLFSYLPSMAMESGGQTFPVTFGYGDEVELNVFLTQREISDTYPLVWLLYPYKEKHTKINLEVENASFILAVETNMSMQNKERLKTTIGNILMPLFFNIRHALGSANIINTNNEYDLVKHPNYSSSDSREESSGVFIWDALKVTTSFTVMDTCLKEIKF
jgi:hypothetical protein